MMMFSLCLFSVFGCKRSLQQFAIGSRQSFNPSLAEKLHMILKNCPDFTNSIATLADLCQDPTLDMNARNEDGATFLMIAASRRIVGIFDLIFSACKARNLDLRVTDHRSRTALHYAFDAFDSAPDCAERVAAQEIIDKLLEYYAQIAAADMLASNE